MMHLKEKMSPVGINDNAVLRVNADLEEPIGDM